MANDPARVSPASIDEQAEVTPEMWEYLMERTSNPHPLRRTEAERLVLGHHAADYHQAVSAALVIVRASLAALPAPENTQLAALKMIQRALDEYFSYSPSRRDEKALGAVQTARKRVFDEIYKAALPAAPETAKVDRAEAALSKSVLPIRDPVVDGLTCDADVPFPIHHELMQAAIAKQISLPWLCAIYRAGATSQEVAVGPDEGQQAYDAGHHAGYEEGYKDGLNGR
jgi:hypothetical protein